MEITHIVLKALLETLNFTIPLLVIIFIAFIFTQILIELGLLKALEFIGRPLTKIANLPQDSGSVFVVSIGSHHAADAMLKNLRENKRITDKEILLSSLFNSTTAPVREIFTFYLPVILPTLGIVVGGIYIATIWLCAFVLLLFVIIAGKILLPKRNYKAKNEDCPKIVLNFKIKEILPIAFKKTKQTFKRIAIIFLIATFIVFLISNFGFFDVIENFILPLANTINLPANVIPAMSIYIISPLVGYASIGSLIQNDEISEKSAILALLLGSIFMIPIFYIKMLLPAWIAIFGLKLGIIRTLIPMFLSMITRTFMLLIILAI